MSKKRRNESYDYLRRTYGVAGTGGQNRAGQGAGAESGEGAELTSGPSRVPARMIETVESTECIVGYRMWSLSEIYPMGFVLVSNMETVWRPFERMVASCKPMHDPMMSIVFGPSRTNTTRYGMPEPRTHRSPDPTGSCYCGINAWKQGVQVSRSDNPNVVSVLGSVNLWGSVIEYPEGYRGQYAYPKELAIVGCADKGKLERIATKLELAYGVPCQVWE